MSQTTSSAVMQQRREPPDSLDDFPTMPWATRALCHALAAKFELKKQTAWEPACGRGHMVRVLEEFFYFAGGSDVFDYGHGYEQVDYLWPSLLDSKADWIITNPPFRLAEQFALKAIRDSRIGSALFVRTAFLEGVGRFQTLFRPHPPSHVFQFTERVPLVKGRLDRTISTATSYCWVVWFKENKSGRTRFGWIPPCRRLLEKDSDYQ